MGKALPTLFIFHRWLPMLVIMMMIMGSAHAFSVCIMVSQGPRGGQTGTTLGGEGPYRVNVPPTLWKLPLLHMASPSRHWYAWGSAQVV